MDRSRQLRARSCDVLATAELVVPRFQSTWFHTAASKLLNEVLRYSRFKGARGGIPRAMVSMPRRHGKSLMCAEMMPSTGLGCSPGLRVMATAYSRELVTEMVDHTKLWMGSEAYRATFPTRLGSVTDRTGKTVKAKEQSAYFKTLIEEPDGSVSEGMGSYFAVGISGGATGRGFDLGIIDDWVKDLDQAYSPAFQRKREGFYDTCFESGAEGVAGIVAVQTEWRPNGFMRWLYDHWTAQGYDVPWLRLSALYDPKLRRDIDVTTLDGRRIIIEDPRQSELSLWPGKFPTAEVQRTRDGLLLRGREHLWDALYQQNPTGQGGVLFPRERWRWYNRDFDLRNIQEIYLSVDPNSKATGKSFGCIGVWGVVDSMSYGTNFFRLDEARGHWSFPELRAETIRLANKWIKALPKAAKNPRSKILVEDRANGPALLAETLPAMKALRPWLQPIPKGRSKEACYREAQSVILRDVDGDSCVWLPEESFGRGDDGSTLVTHDWARGEGGFVEECYSQQPVAEPNDRPDEMAQMLVYRIYGPERMRSL